MAVMHRGQQAIRLPARGQLTRDTREETEPVAPVLALLAAVVQERLEARVQETMVVLVALGWHQASQAQA